MTSGGCPEAQPLKLENTERGNSAKHRFDPLTQAPMFSTGGTYFLLLHLAHTLPLTAVRTHSLVVPVTVS